MWQSGIQEHSTYFFFKCLLANCLGRMHFSFDPGLIQSAFFYINTDCCWSPENKTFLVETKIPVRCDQYCTKVLLSYHITCISKVTAVKWPFSVLRFLQKQPFADVLQNKCSQKFLEKENTCVWGLQLY